jgi:nitrogen regulatory protein P-II 1
MSDMFKVEIITRNSTDLEAFKMKMAEIGVSGMTFSHVQGCGLEEGYTELYRGVKKVQNVFDRLKIEIVVSSVPVDDIIKAAASTLHTGKAGDGKIFVHPIQQTIDINTGKQGPDAL